MADITHNPLLPTPFGRTVTKKITVCDSRHKFLFRVFRRPGSVSSHFMRWSPAPFTRWSPAPFTRWILLMGNTPSSWMFMSKSSKEFPAAVMWGSGRIRDMKQLSHSWIWGLKEEGDPMKPSVVSGGRHLFFFFFYCSVCYSLINRRSSRNLKATSHQPEFHRPPLTFVTSSASKWKITEKFKFFFFSWLQSWPAVTRSLQYLKYAQF